ncbi:MAG: leucine--tRNA ligase [Candidatus Sericytochromatia bacterium]|nr:leucine--tRNA ligase [Candidatus Tanganyikabacteria bacterium]
MHEKYDPQGIEARWQEAWAKDRVFEVAEDPAKRDRAFYALTMFPYPSGDRLHMGHMRTYTITDAIARWMRMKGRHVLHPMGWDAFGLPAENAAIKRGVHPAKWTWENIEYIRDKQMKRMGFSYDWTREFATCSPEYYRWNQWFFLKLYEHGLAYRKEAAVNWCPTCATVLANEQVEDGKCWRCEAVVEKRDLMQWFYKITDYAEELLAGLDDLDGWPEKVRAIQRNWIGKSTGAELAFKVKNHPGAEIRVFTTRPDTTCGVTYVVLAPEHPLVAKLTTAERKGDVDAFVARMRAATELERTSTEAEKEGVPIGAYAINPFTGEEIPVWIANYVLYEYGTGAVMGVPAHDERDYAFAKKYGFPIPVVIEPPPGVPAPRDNAYTAPGVMVNSGRFDEMHSEDAIAAMTKFAEQNGFGKSRVTYRLRDWLISRQRYWGTPIPVVHCEKCGTVPLPEEQLPLILPENVQFTGHGKSPLHSVPEWVDTTCPECDGPAQRETDTMDGFMCSSWYHMRYTDPRNDKAPFDLNKAAYWLPVDLYVGGVEHAIMHLLYFRFFNRFCFKQGWVPSPEPNARLFTQGTVRYNGMRMSKSKGNAVSPNDLADEFGVDTARVFTLFASPPESDLDWIDTGVIGANKFLKRVWTQVYDTLALPQRPGEPMAAADREIRRQAHLATKKVTDDLEREFGFNTSISHIMVLSNSLGEYLRTPAPQAEYAREAAERLVLLLAPFAPHVAEELWRELGHASYVAFAPWPTYDTEALRTDEIELAVQVNGKVRGRIRVPAEADQKKIEVAALADEETRPHLDGKQVVKVIIVPGRLVNIVAK